MNQNKSVRINAQLHQALRIIAAREGKTISEVIENILQANIPENEQLEVISEDAPYGSTPTNQ